MQFDDAIQNFRSIGISILLYSLRPPTHTHGIGIRKCILLSLEKEKVKPKGKTPRASGAVAVMGKWGTFANHVNSNGSGGRVEKKSRRAIECNSSAKRFELFFPQGGCFYILYKP